MVARFFDRAGISSISSLRIAASNAACSRVIVNAVAAAKRFSTVPAFCKREDASRKPSISML
jgi:intein/homing endonuclease